MHSLYRITNNHGDGTQRIVWCLGRILREAVSCPALMNFSLGRFITQDLSFFICTMEAVGELILEVSSNFLNILQRYVLLSLQKGNIFPVLVNRGA